MFSKEYGSLVFESENDHIKIEPYGVNCLRVRARKDNSFGARDYALLPANEVSTNVSICEDKAEITNGTARATIDKNGKICFYNEAGKLLLEEHYTGKPLKVKGHW